MSPSESPNSNAPSHAYRFGVVLCLVLALLGLQAPASAAGAYDWPQFDGNAQHSGNNTQETTITSGNVSALHKLFSTSLADTADGAPAYLNSIPTASGVRDLLFVTTKSGWIEALDAHSNLVVWSRQFGAPTCFINGGGTPCYTTSSPAIDPNRQFVYTYGLDGQVHKLDVRDGSEVSGAGWIDLDPANLSLNLTPTTTCNAVISANADLWTATAGFNQDLGINIAGGSYGTGLVVAWKESGGFAGTYSPNAAFVHTVKNLQAGLTYTIKLQWKTNRAGISSIRDAAGGGAPFSPTRLTAECIPSGSSTTVTTASSTQQYALDNSNGTSWVDMDSTNLSVTVTPTTACTTVLSANADLWTATPGINQDLGISIAGGSYGTGQIAAWKESGGFAGTFSPNAAFVHSVQNLQAGITYTIKLQWKANKTGFSAIRSGAGGAAPFSPTRLTAKCIPTGSSTTVTTAGSTQQYALDNNNAGWVDMDPSNLSLNVAPSTACSAIISANADLWTATAGFNQDLGIWISGGSYGAGQVVAWKESGGFAGTYSPNAAFVETVQSLQAGVSYTMKLQWKTNKGGVSAIRAGAGGSAPYSPTRFTAECL